MGCFASNSKNNKIEVSNPVQKKKTLDSLPSTIKENLKETDSGSKFTRKIQKEKEKKLLPEISKLSPIESRGFLQFFFTLNIILFRAKP